MITYKKCSEVKIDDIVKAFNAGFADYIIKLQMTPELLTKHFLNAEQNKLETSFIAFDDDKPIGLMLGGIKNYEGLKTLRCGALCVDPNYRKLGVASNLFSLHKDLAIANNCDRLYLEVIKGNDKAINFYLKQGYKVLSELEYYSHSRPQLITSPVVSEFDIQKVDLEEIEDLHNNKVKTHLHFQNDFDYMRFFSQLESYKLHHQGITQCAISILPTGKIFYLWTDSKADNLEYAKALLSYVVRKWNLPKLSISFPKSESFSFFLTELGFSKDEVGQYEMELILV